MSSLAGIELLTIDARVVVASVDTYLRFAEAVNRLDLRQTEEKGLPELFGQRKDDQRRNGSRSSGGSDTSGTSGDERHSRRRESEGAQRRPQLREGDPEHRNPGDGEEDSGGLLEKITERARR